MKGCAMFACGVEAASNIHPPHSWWRRDTMKGAPDEDAVALTSDRKRVLVSAVNSRRARSLLLLAREVPGAPRKGVSQESHVATATGRCMEPTRVCRVRRKGVSEAGSISGKGSSSPKKARGVGIAADTANEVHRNESAEADVRESSILSSLLTARTGGGGLTEAITRARRCLAAPQTPPGGS